MTVKTEKPSQLRVLITAGASGIGRVIAESFAQTGARLHICDIADAALDEAKKNHPTWGVSRCDVSQSDQVAGLFEEVGNNLGGLDVLIN
ncbi:MAG: SDR family oxidoreductase, partial [Rhodobacterales bacterium]